MSQVTSREEPYTFAYLNNLEDELGHTLMQSQAGCQGSHQGVRVSYWHPGPRKIAILVKKRHPIFWSEFFEK